MDKIISEGQGQQRTSPPGALAQVGRSGERVASDIRQVSRKELTVSRQDRAPVGGRAGTRGRVPGVGTGRKWRVPPLDLRHGEAGRGVRGCHPGRGLSLPRCLGEGSPRTAASSQLLGASGSRSGGRTGVGPSGPRVLFSAVSVAPALLPVSACR